MTIISNCTAAALKDAAASLIAGNLVAFPTETVYGLGADASNQQAVARIYEVKGRPTDHPLIVHISSINKLDKWAKDIPEYAVKLARNFWPGPMTLILPRTDLAKDFITGSQDNVGIRVPSHTVALALLQEFESQGGIGVAAPSANRFGKVSPTCADDVKAELYDYLNSKDLILDGGLSFIGVESTIINCINTMPSILRPGAITATMINNLLGIQIEVFAKNDSDQIRVPGLLESHYSPKARVFLSGTPAIGDGFIALSKFPTPPGVIRLTSPATNEEYARTLYQGLRLADSKKLSKVFVIEPAGNDIAVAVCDRLQKAAEFIVNI
ncbi:L-threonylcarbamoyladenylate synthase [Candidatus Nanopelagicus abundans]|uniref:Threonylcarbamoyl-AMP synthase n=1 Tax=Candidatus Nanopelagicus abundans TaxID=1884916 RepID=A0A249L640_9ACTN|nr:L-threonylcarbamoyladenylate synthase [Candidatus Nanopelagicus abundans]ASY24467.1 L-threonylcarbamoyladenylate synthase [Candidatus Nanopelagicus abundans]